MTITLKLNEEAAGLLKNMLEEEISNGSRMSGPDCQEARALLSDLSSVSSISGKGRQPTLLQHYPNPLFGDGVVAEGNNVISNYSREDALADGTLVGVTDMAQQIGYDPS